MNFRYFYHQLINNTSLSNKASLVLNFWLNIVLIGLASYVVMKILRFLILKIVAIIIKRKNKGLDYFLAKRKAFFKLSRLIVLLGIFSLLPSIFNDYPSYLSSNEKAFKILIIILVMGFIRASLYAIGDYLKTKKQYKDKPLKSYIQICLILLWGISLTISFSIITGVSLYSFLTALGAFSAILLLIFKDTILGFVASVQVSLNDTIRIGDWVTMEKYGADGDVTEINLTSVIVKNFDNTITSIPTYYLISDSFKNWRTMSNSGGRRIKRAFNIKMNSIQFLDETTIEKLKGIELIQNYLETKSAEINEYNSIQNHNKTVLINGRNLTNFGVFRKYIDLYLEQHPKINNDLLMMCRQLDPKDTGIPLEIYAFSKLKKWEDYERVMADIFDHILASVPYFDLEIYENPSSIDVKNLANKLHVKS